MIDFYIYWLTELLELNVLCTFLIYLTEILTNIFFLFLFFFLHFLIVQNLLQISD